jgi:hypothetical protein
MSSANVDTLRDSASDAFEQLQRVATPAIKQGKRQAGVLLDQGGELVGAVGTRASETAAELGETAMALGKNLLAYTKKNPLTALLLAIGAGALLISAAKSNQSRR